MEKRSYLLNRAHKVTATNHNFWKYDENLQLNFTVNKEGSHTPVCTLSSMITASKTESAPGDDDPDPDAEICY
jgi:hypothetical protein